MIRRFTVAEIIEFKCPHCQTNLKAGTDLSGQKGKCPNCKKDITVPKGDAHSPSGEKDTSKK
jgi:hypothetical protein